MIYRILFALEPPKSIDFTNKKDPKKGQFVNGGLDAHRFELIVQRYINNLDTQDTTKICYLINKLLKIA